MGTESRAGCWERGPSVTGTGHRSPACGGTRPRPPQFGSTALTAPSSHPIAPTADSWPPHSPPTEGTDRGLCDGGLLGSGSSASPQLLLDQSPAPPCVPRHPQHPQHHPVPCPQLLAPSDTPMALAPTTLGTPHSRVPMPPLPPLTPQPPPRPHNSLMPCCPPCGHPSPVLPVPPCPPATSMGHCRPPMPASGLQPPLAVPVPIPARHLGAGGPAMPLIGLPVPRAPHSPSMPRGPISPPVPVPLAAWGRGWPLWGGWGALEGRERENRWPRGGCPTAPRARGRGRRCPSRWIASPGPGPPWPRGHPLWGCWGQGARWPLAPGGQAQAPHQPLWHPGGSACNSQPHAPTLLGPAPPARPQPPKRPGLAAHLLELAGLVVLSALQEVEQDDIAQHRALRGGTVGAGGCPGRTPQHYRASVCPPPWADSPRRWR